MKLAHWSEALRVNKKPSLRYIVGLWLLLSLTAVFAETMQDKIIEEVRVTGTHIKGLTQNEMVPITILQQHYIDGLAANSVSDIINKLTVSSGAENRSDSLTQGFSQGTENINLRGLGLSSTLVLLNGRRQAVSGALANDGSVFVDTSSIPINAIERVEVLKEGAASTYGSDAIAGVINFILRTNFDGFEITSGHQRVHNGDQSDNSIGVLWGNQFGDTSITLATHYLQRSALRGPSRPTLIDNAISGLGSTFITSSSASVSSGPYAGDYAKGEYIPNAQCEEYTEAILSSSVCRFFYGPRFNLVAAETRLQFFTNLTHNFSNGSKLSADLGYSNNKVTENPQSPSYPDLTFPLIPATHPSNPLKIPLTWLGRPFAFGYPSPNAPRANETIRASMGLEGYWDDNWAWETALTHSQNVYKAIQPDTISSRLKDAFNGSGGPNADEYYDPFIPENNSQALYDYLAYETEVERTSKLTVVDGIISGDIYSIDSELNIGLAAGIHIRRETYTTEADDLYEIKFNSDGDPIPVDLIFLGGVSEMDESRTDYAAFVETQIPLKKDFLISAALRYENLDSDTSLDPKVALNWKINPKLSLRASASTAFRQPSLAQVHARQVQLERIQDKDSDGSDKGSPTFVRILQAGSDSLVAEESDNFHFGVHIQPSKVFDIKLDYWMVGYNDLITVENAQSKVNSNPNDSAIIRSASGNLSGVIVDYFNASQVDVSGLDLAIKWKLKDSLLLSFDSMHLLNYEISLPNGNVIDVAGELNRSNFARSLPETKISSNLIWTGNKRRADLNVYRVSSYKNVNEDIDAYTSIDAKYSFYVSNASDKGEISISFGVKNLFDELPPRVNDGGNFSYDSKQHSPLGRIFFAQLGYSL
ncbi:MAG: TonB-dependent receptor [Cellvibrionales bacterium TMED49]|nr:TonB-dependent receptor [Porticoccaceae bacterium]OUU38277.1 MAG: TonB-dependent receptor [Cellvibrionales bacterium TMED49]